MTKYVKPTESELEILQILWKHGPQSVRFVHEQLSKGKETGYTTTLKIMQLMVDKHLAKRDTSNKSHIYCANIRKENTQKQLLSSFIKKTFSGSASNLVLQALGTHKPSTEELERIKELINKIENQQ